jgi:hypothetical protein
VSDCTVWLKTLNLALMGGTPQYIHLFIDFVFTFIFIFWFYFSRITCVFSFQRQKGTSIQVWGCAMRHADPTVL